MSIQTFIFNSIRTCMYVVWDEAGSCAFIDATCITTSEQQRVDKFVAEHELAPAAIFNTHAHPDHVCGNAYLCRRYGITAYLHPMDNAWLSRSAMHGASIGMVMEQPPAARDMDSVVRFGSMELQVLHTPGHSSGCVCLYSSKNGVVFTGDTLFAGCIGRTDLEDGNYDQIMHSIRTQLLVLDGDTRVLPGHGGTTTIGTERTTNPFLQ